MSYNTDLDAKLWQAKDFSPNTRESVHLLTKWYPIEKTLTITDVAEDLFTAQQVPATINLIENPSFETGDPPTGFTASGAALAQNLIYYLYGSHSIRVTPADVVAGEGFYVNLGKYPRKSPAQVMISASIYARDLVDSGEGVRVAIYGVTNGSWIFGSTVELSTSWQRSIVSFSPDIEQEYRVYVITATKHAIVFYCDGFQVENTTSVTEYCDGEQNSYCDWDGTPHASTSRRLKKAFSIRTLTLYTDRDVYIAYDTTASPTVGRKVKAGTDFWLDFPVYITKNISFININSGELPKVYGELWGI